MTAKLCTVKPVYKGHSKEPENVAVWEDALYLQVKIICTIHLWEIRLPFIDSDLLYTGVLYRLIYYIQVSFIDSDLL